MQATPVSGDRIFLYELLEAKLVRKGRPDELEKDGSEVTASREDLIKMHAILIYFIQRRLK